MIKKSHLYLVRALYVFFTVVAIAAVVMKNVYNIPFPTWTKVILTILLIITMVLVIKIRTCPICKAPNGARMKFFSNEEPVCRNCGENIKIK